MAMLLAETTLGIGAASQLLLAVTPAISRVPPRLQGGWGLDTLYIYIYIRYVLEHALDRKPYIISS